MRIILKQCTRSGTLQGSTLVAVVSPAVAAIELALAMHSAAIGDVIVT